MSTENTDPNTENTQGVDPAAGGDAAVVTPPPAADDTGSVAEPSIEEQEQALVEQALAGAAAAEGVAAPAADGVPAADATKDGKPAGEQDKPEGKKEGDDGATPDEAAAEAEKLGIGKNEAANAKFKELYNKVAEFEKKTVPELQQRAERYEQHVQHIEATGASPDQYQSALHIIGAVNRGGPTEWAQARDYLMKEVALLDERLGNGKPGEDVLSAHADLQEAVDSGAIDQRYAEELARARGQTKAVQTWQENQSETTRQQETQQQEAQQCRETLNALELRIKASDPEWDRKREILVPILTPVLAALPYAQRPEAFIKAYQDLKLPPAEPHKTQLPPPTHQPLRPTGGNGQVAKVPTTEMEALEQGLEAYAQAPHAYG